MSSHGGRTDADLRLELLVHENFGRVAAYLLSRTDRESAGEALARTLEVVWRRLEDVPAEPLPWLLGVARRVLADQWRAQNRQDALISRLTESETVRQGAATSEREANQDAAVERLVAIRALAALTDSDREALLMVAWDGLTTRQAAAVLGCSRGTFSVRLFRARSRLRDQLSAHTIAEPNTSAPRAPKAFGMPAINPQVKPRRTSHEQTDE